MSVPRHKRRNEKGASRPLFGHNTLLVKDRLTE
jgi:hypothetical protein